MAAGVLWACLLLLAVSSALVAQTGLPIAGTPQDAPSEERTESPSDRTPEGLASPRATMRTFLEGVVERDWDRVAPTLTLEAGLAADAATARSREVAAQLKAVMDRVELVSYEEIPEEVDGDRWVWRRVEGIPIALERGDDGAWRFSRGTVESLPELSAAVEDRDVVAGAEAAPRTFAMWLRDQMPESLRSGGFLIETWQWLALGLLILVGVFVDRTVTFLLERLLARRLVGSLGGQAIDPALVHSAIRPFGLVVMALLWWVGLLLLGLPTRALIVLLVAVKFVAIASLVWAAYRTVDIVAALLEHRAEQTETRYDDLLIPLLRRSAKIFIAAFGVVFLADNLNINITSLLAGLGLGGIAFALAAQDTVKNLFGSITVLVDRPFQVGDWVRIGEVDGTVEEVGFRSTRIRTFYNSQITLPNANLISASVDNYGARRYRRWRTTLAVTYDTPPESIDAFCEGIRELVRRHPYTRKDYFHVYFNEFGAHSLDVLLYVFFEVPDWATELRERHRLGVDIVRLAHRLGIEFAFPTQTLYLKRGGEPEATAEDPEYGEHVSEAGLGARRVARELVRASLGDRVPPPVNAEPQSLDDEPEEWRRGGDG